MAASYQFTHQLPNNSSKLKRAFIGLTIGLLLCIAGMIIAELLWDEFTYPAYSFKLRRNITGGWPPKVFNWSLWLAVAIVIAAPMMYFMQDFKNPSIALTNDHLFINQQMLRNTLVPYSNVKMVVKEKDGYTIVFNNTDEVVKQQVFLFKPFIKSNLAKGNFFISDMYTSGNIDELMEELKKRIPTS